MGQTPQDTRRRQRLQELGGAAIRAFTGEAELQLRAGGLFHRHRRVSMPAPHLKLQPEGGSLRDYRGSADGMALRWRCSDARLHRELCPAEPVPRLVFELLEQLRAESLAPAGLPGMRDNLERRFAAWSHEFHHSGLNETAFGVLLYTLAQMAWARLNARPVLAETEDFIEATRAGIAPLIGRELALLKRHREDQALYARAALAIADTVQGLLQTEREALGGASDESAEDEALQAALRLLFDADEESGDEGGVAVGAGPGRVFEDAEGGYRVFSTRYDREVPAAGLVRPELLRELRERLDEFTREQGVNLARLSRRLAALFARPARDGWNFGEEEGYVDGSRLSQLVSSPAERRLFRTVRMRPGSDAVVGLLIDCSGSMRAHIEKVAVLVDVLCRALHQAGVSSEVLGFTTGAWNGGRVQQEWMAQGRPPHPGRLNEVTYMVYKDAETSWRRARGSLAALLKPDLFREGVDGEAVDWACNRLLARDESRRVLLVISDGCPMDTATSLANDRAYLDRHLKTVLERRDRQGEVEIYGLGVAQDLSPHYRHCTMLDLSRGLGNRVFADILDMLARKRA